MAKHVVVRRRPGKGAQDLIVTLRADDIPTILCGLSRQEVREAAPERVARIQRTLEDALSSG